jgi:hypothetical protein
MRGCLVSGSRKLLPWPWRCFERAAAGRAADTPGLLSLSHYSLTASGFVTQQWYKHAWITRCFAMGKLWGASHQLPAPSSPPPATLLN